MKAWMRVARDAIVPAARVEGRIVFGGDCIYASGDNEVELTKRFSNERQNKQHSRSLLYTIYKSVQRSQSGRSTGAHARLCSNVYISREQYPCPGGMAGHPPEEDHQLIWKKLKSYCTIEELVDVRDEI